MPKKPKDPNQTSNPPGRPHHPIDWEAFDTLCQMHCTLEEFAFFFGCSEDTIERAVKREKQMGFADYFRSRCVGGRLSLRRRIWEKALNQDDGPSQRFLAQQKEERGGLGFSDKVTVDGTPGAGAYEQMMGIVNRLESKKREQKKK